MVEVDGIQHAVAGAEYGEPVIAAMFTLGFFLNPASLICGVESGIHF